MRDKIQEIVIKAVAQTIDLTDAIDELLNLHSVSDSFSADKIKEAYTDGFSDSIYDFDTENYR